MILDKTSIEELLYTDAKEFEKVAEKKEDGIFIRTDTEQNFFDKSQIGNDSIDLRISDYGYSRKGTLWKILNEAGLYTKSKQNWCRRVY